MNEKRRLKSKTFRKVIKIVMFLFLAFFLFIVIPNIGEWILEWKVKQWTKEVCGDAFEFRAASIGKEQDIVYISYTEHGDFQLSIAGDIYRSVVEYFWKENAEKYDGYILSIRFETADVPFSVYCMPGECPYVEVKYSLAFNTDDVLEAFPDTTHLIVRKLYYDSLEELKGYEHLKQISSLADFTQEEKDFFHKYYPDVVLKEFI